MKLGLVLAGGGARGAYEIGVYRALKELNIEFDIITGTSVGAINMFMIVQHDFEELTKVWENITFEGVMNHKFKWKNKGLEVLLKAPLHGGFKTEPLRDVINNHYCAEKIRNSNIKGGLVYTTRGRKYNALKLDDISDEDIPKFVLISSSAKPFLKPIVHNGVQCYDGYYSDNVPLKLALDMGADKCICIDIMKGFRQKCDESKAIYIKPTKKMQFFLNFDHKYIEENFELGYEDTMKMKDEILKFIKE